MDKEFVSYEIALALKELGFNEECFGCYQLSELRDYKKGLEVSWIMTLNTLNGYRIYDDETQMSAPLKQRVFRWFREKYNIQGYIYSSTVRGNKEGTKQFTGYVWNINGIDIPFISTDARDELHDTYEEAENACIDKLIEICKQQDNEGRYTRS